MYINGVGSAYLFWAKCKQIYMRTRMFRKLNHWWVIGSVNFLRNGLWLQVSRLKYCFTASDIYTTFFKLDWIEGVPFIFHTWATKHFIFQFWWVQSMNQFQWKHNTPKIPRIRFSNCPNLSTRCFSAKKNIITSIFCYLLIQRCVYSKKFRHQKFRSIKIHFKLSGK